MLSRICIFVVFASKNILMVRGCWRASVDEMTSPIWNVVRYGGRKQQTKHLCWLIIINKTSANRDNQHFPSIQPWAEQRNEFIIHQKGLKQLTRDENKINFCQTLYQTQTTAPSWTSNYWWSCSPKSNGIVCIRAVFATLVNSKTPNQSVFIQQGFKSTNIEIC